MVESISHSQGTQKTQQTRTNYHQEATKVSVNPEKGKTSTITDKVSLQGESTALLTYSESMALNAGDDSKYGILQNLVTNLLKEQGIDTKIAIGEKEIDINSITMEEAQELVADDGYFGVEQTSERIFQFAVGITGGDPSRIDAIKEGVDKGFQEALKVFGGELPDISHETYDAVMNKLDNWVAETQG